MGLLWITAMKMIKVVVRVKGRTMFTTIRIFPTMRQSLMADLGPSTTLSNRMLGNGRAGGAWGPEKVLNEKSPAGPSLGPRHGQTF